MNKITEMTFRYADDNAEKHAKKIHDVLKKAGFIPELNYGMDNSISIKVFVKSV